MLLLVDVGNTRLKWALAQTADGAGTSAPLGRWLRSGAVEHADARQWQELRQIWTTLAVTRMIASNVAGEQVAAALGALCADAFGGGLPIRWFRSQAQLCGVRNTYRDPTQLGSDRFAGMIAAHALFPEQALIVANCGTATTIDALSADGCFIGGMILPGLTLMNQALSRNTAQLPQVAQFGESQKVFADNTDDAIRSGSVTAVVGAIERACALHAEQQGAIACVLTGGAAPTLSPFFARAHRTVENLVLIGLQVVNNGSN